MSLADDLDDFFAETGEVVVKEPLKFKAKLGIGERAYASLRSREKLTTISEALGIGGTAAGLASSGAVANTFFASSGFIASKLSVIGLGAAAVTPVGWVIAAGVISGGLYAGMTSLLERNKDNGLIIVPKYINTPLDVIAVALIELMLPVSLKIAHAGNGMDHAEQNAIQDYFSEEWGYSPGFVLRLIEEYREQIDSVSYSKLAQSLGNYCAESRDCDKQAIMSGFVFHLREIIEADGVIEKEEREELDYLTGLLIQESEKNGGGFAVTDAIKAASKGISGAGKTASEIATTIGSSAASGLSKSTDYLTGTGKSAIELSSKLINDISESEIARPLKETSEQLATKSSDIAASSLETGKMYASKAGEFTARKAKSLWGSVSKLVTRDPKEKSS